MGLGVRKQRLCAWFALDFLHQFLQSHSDSLNLSSTIIKSIKSVQHLPTSLCGSEFHHRLESRGLYCGNHCTQNNFLFLLRISKSIARKQYLRVWPGQTGFVVNRDSHLLLKDITDSTSPGSSQIQKTILNFFMSVLYSLFPSLVFIFKSQ